MTIHGRGGACALQRGDRVARPRWL